MEPGRELRGVPFEAATHAGSPRVEAIPYSAAELYHSHQRRESFIWCVMILLPYLHLHCSPIQYSVITRGTKRAKTQADFGDKPPRITGLYLGSRWDEAEGAEAKVTLQEDIWRSLLRFGLVDTPPSIPLSTPLPLILLSSADQVE